MSADGIVEILLAVIFLGTPAAALAARWVFRPMVRDLAEAINSIKQPINPEIARRLTEIEEEQRQIGERLDRLIEAERFNRELGSGTPQE